MAEKLLMLLEKAEQLERDFSKHKDEKETRDMHITYPERINDRHQERLLQNGFAPVLRHTPISFLKGVPSFGPSTKQFNNDKLTTSEIRALLHASLRNQKHGFDYKGKRNLAIVCLTVDVHLSASSISRLTFGDIKGIVSAVQKNENLLEDNYCIEFTGSRSQTISGCHPLTAWSLGNLVRELTSTHHWNFDDANPLFVRGNLGLFNGDFPKILRRDAISKVFSSVKDKANVEASAIKISRSTFAVLENDYLEILREIQEL